MQSPRARGSLEADLGWGGWRCISKAYNPFDPGSHPDRPTGRQPTGRHLTPLPRSGQPPPDGGRSKATRGVGSLPPGRGRRRAQLQRLQGRGAFRARGLRREDDALPAAPPRGSHGGEGATHRSVPQADGQGAGARGAAGLRPPPRRGDEAGGGAPTRSRGSASAPTGPTGGAPPGGGAGAEGAGARWADGSLAPCKLVSIGEMNQGRAGY